MQVLQIVTQMEGGGAQRAAILTARELRHRGVHIETCFMFKKRSVYDQEPETFCLMDHAPRNPLDYILILWRLFRLLQKKNPDAVLTFTHYANVFGCTFAFLCGIPIRAARQTGLPHHNPLLARILDPIVGAIGIYTANITNSGTTTKAYEKFSTSYRRRIRVVFDGVETIQSHRNKTKARGDYEIPTDAFVILNVGRLSAVKNQVRLLKAVAKVDSVCLVIAGDGEDRKLIETTIKTLKLTKRVFLLGDISPEELANVYGLADAFVFTSLWESFGMAVLEAAGAGLPLAVSAIPAILETTQGPNESPKDNALYFDPVDIDAIAEAIEYLKNQPELRERLHQRSLKLAKPYGVKAMSDGFLAVLKEGGGK